MTEASVLVRLLRARHTVVPVARARLSLLRLSLPELPPRKQVAAVRLQLLQFYPSGRYAFACRSKNAGTVIVWAWEAAAGEDDLLPQQWPEPLLEQDAAPGLRLLRRAPGFEAQHWDDQGLQASQWFAQSPSQPEWQRFVRACGIDPDAHPFPATSTALSLAQSPKGWLRGDSLPEPDPWRGWHWQAGGLTAAMLICAALGVHLQARSQLAADKQALAELRHKREATLQSRSAYEQARTQLDTLQALAPQLSQLELLDRILSSGVLAVSGSLPAPAIPGTPAQPGTVLAQPAGTPPPIAPTAVLSSWEFRNAQLKITLEIPDGDLPMLDITRRIEAVPGLRDLKVGQESAPNTVVLSMRIGNDAATSSSQ